MICVIPAVNSCPVPQEVNFEHTQGQVFQQVHFSHAHAVEPHPVRTFLRTFGGQCHDLGNGGLQSMVSAEEHHFPESTTITKSHFGSGCATALLEPRGLKSPIVQPVDMQAQYGSMIDAAKTQAQSNCTHSHELSTKKDRSSFVSLHSSSCNSWMERTPVQQPKFLEERAEQDFPTHCPGIWATPGNQNALVSQASDLHFAVHPLQPAKICFTAETAKNSVQIRCTYPMMFCDILAVNSCLVPQEANFEHTQGQVFQQVQSSHAHALEPPPVRTFGGHCPDSANGGLQSTVSAEEPHFSASTPSTKSQFGSGCDTALIEPRDLKSHLGQPVDMQAQYGSSMAAAKTQAQSNCMHYQELSTKKDRSIFVSLRSPCCNSWMERAPVQKPKLLEERAERDFPTHCPGIWATPGNQNAQVSPESDLHFAARPLQQAKLCFTAEAAENSVQNLCPYQYDRSTQMDRSILVPMHNQSSASILPALSQSKPIRSMELELVGVTQHKLRDSFL